MRSAVSSFVLRSVLWFLWLLRRLFSIDGRTYAVMHLSQVQWFLARVGRMGAQAVYLKAVQSCPAYQDFLSKMGHKKNRRWRLEALPERHSSPGTRLNIGQIGSRDDISRFSSRDFSIENVQCLKMRPFIEPATFEVDRDLQRRVKAVRAMFYNHFPAVRQALRLSPGATSWQ